MIPQPTDKAAEALSLAQAGQKNLLELNVAEGLIAQLIAGHSPIETVVVTNRLLRKNNANVETLQAQGKLGPNETYIGVKLIDQNIKTALPPLLSYLKQSPRLATFSPGNNGYLDAEFTRVMQPTGWEVPYIEVLDGAELNGLSYMQVRNDPTSLGSVALKCIPFDEIIYDRRLKSIQDSPLVMIKHVVTSVSFYDWDSFENFDKDSDGYKNLAKQLLSSAPDAISDNLVIFETYVKVSGLVYRGWYYKGSKQWLKAPLPFSNGIEESVPQVSDNPEDVMATPTLVRGPVHLTYYPIVVKSISITENTRHIEIEGTAADSYNKQEAVTNLMTDAVNGCKNASRTMWSPDGQNTDGAAPKQLQFTIARNAIWQTPMRAFTAPWPDPMIFKGIEGLIQQNATENNQVAWAVNNRKDTRKTAAEITAATSQQSLLTGTSALVFSIFLRDLFTMTWPIVQSAAIAGRIQFLTKMPEEEKQTALSKPYEVKPAGDIDFAEREQRINMLLQDLPMFQGTPVGKLVMAEYIRLRYPDKATEWAEGLGQSNDDQLIQGLAQALQAAVTSPEGQLKPEFAPEQQALQQLQQAVQQRLAQTPNASQPQQGQSAPMAPQP
jgi:hypothetical protein